MIKRHDTNINNDTDDPEVWWKQQQQVQAEHEEVHQEDKIELTNKKKLSFWNHFRIQLFICIVLFIAFVFAQKLDEKNDLKAMRWIESAIHTDIPFIQLATWYENTFAGSPSFIPLFDNKSQQAISKKINEPLPLPVPDSLIIRSFADSLTGLELSTDKGADVFTVGEGRVIFVRDEGDTVIVQHNNQYVTIYSKMTSTAVELNQWVKAGDKIGKMSETLQKPLLFYAIKRENEYIDPLGVMSFD